MRGMLKSSCCCLQTTKQLLFTRCSCLSLHITHSAVILKTSTRVFNSGFLRYLGANYLACRALILVRGVTNHNHSQHWLCQVLPRVHFTKVQQAACTRQTLLAGTLQRLLPHNKTAHNQPRPTQYTTAQESQLVLVMVPG